MGNCCVSAPSVNDHVWEAHASEEPDGEETPRESGSPASTRHAHGQGHGNALVTGLADLPGDLHNLIGDYLPAEGRGALRETSRAFADALPRDARDVTHPLIAGHQLLEMNAATPHHEVSYAIDRVLEAAPRMAPPIAGGQLLATARHVVGTLGHHPQQAALLARIDAAMAAAGLTPQEWNHANYMLQMTVWGRAQARS
jgi:hypothetical protein